MSAKREPESLATPADEHGEGAASGNKRIKANPAPSGPKPATRASTGAPITLTAKGSLYRAHKDTGESDCLSNKAALVYQLVGSHRIHLGRAWVVWENLVCAFIHTHDLHAALDRRIDCDMPQLDGKLLLSTSHE